MHLSATPAPTQPGGSWRDRASGTWTDLPLRTKRWVVLTVPLVVLLLGTAVFYLQDRREQVAAAAVRQATR
ncbi:MAG TPA: hypothetical protein VKB09_17425, partial [Thermomicrobiales bacterium]|nr:hypothetical protein [Thermomicrobiales bacterium]